MSGAQLHEIFSSIQGEGLYVGDRQLFIRFSGCNLSCDYCDSKEALTLQPQFKVEDKKIDNPVTAEKLLEIVSSFTKNKNLHSAISITGGEPLLQVDFLAKFLPELKIPVYLETNGTLPNHLSEIINHVNIISMDFKAGHAKEHFHFMEIAYTSGKELFVKFPVGPEVTTKDIDEAAGLISQISPLIPLVLQPLHPIKIKKDQLLSFQAVAKRKLERVKIIPQVHKILHMF
ncbi:hypothetical protein A2276_06460 [candidate division WOR-1 bacterium RIFOXYA12_FULL_43_27]|uniref:7-carboxy-7-deazaguanine synthase n=1 Tax=candidate division WOR-1 bacterium RIFOXYC2_FULL_46_14 TaxID=1802587 RepID=A0A1F4U5I7_UNCSA|nr:MAG: hypothetical protein A2276_06460 [candidate division WOR-1 bacterium RIFOXYA12_FULL_43_27]OGC20293.1 MAG: hypothetical protein A2292_04460 [candidate division WOR-1 bacterium RIFOXYB2_FULL_46_45]OGC31970.1 MAG: hypothetical protein A2232_06990 [candidate division WOR-1 bacterium RIFOXYA2_FULL_46_56]OGC40139.1 MAG: hypothetical protein A2438_02480 [candidate division WOR-1 bacterium RIFOXYC2_FULL_46_14]